MRFRDLLLLVFFRDRRLQRARAHITQRRPRAADHGRAGRRVPRRAELDRRARGARRRRAPGLRAHGGQRVIRRRSRHGSRLGRTGRSHGARRCDGSRPCLRDVRTDCGRPVRRARRALPDREPRPQGQEACAAQSGRRSGRRDLAPAAHRRRSAVPGPARAHGACDLREPRRRRQCTARRPRAAVAGIPDRDVRGDRDDEHARCAGPTAPRRISSTCSAKSA